MNLRILQVVAAVVLAAAVMGGSCDGWFNVTQPLTDAVTIAVINETPYRAIFTAGAFDLLDQKTVPEPQPGQVRLEGKGADPQLGIRWFETDFCRRAVAIGSEQLIDLIKDRDFEDDTFEVEDTEALIVGVNFSDAPAGSPDEANPTRGTAEPITALQGIDYPCGALLVFKFLEDADAPGGFRIEFATIF